MKVKTINAIGTYNVLKQVKVNSLSDDSAIAVWKDIKSLREVVNDYEAAIDIAKKSVVDDEFTAKQKEYAELAAIANPTDEDKAKANAIKVYFDTKQAQINKYNNELLLKEADIDVTKLTEAELLKAVKDAGLNFDAMEALEMIME
jgi:hypothetical protein